MDEYDFIFIIHIQTFSASFQIRNVTNTKIIFLHCCVSDDFTGRSNLFVSNN